MRPVVHILALISVASLRLWAGPYSPAAGQPGSDAVPMDSEDIVAWATGWSHIEYGEDVADEWKIPGRATGPATGDSADVVSLGRGGHITLTFLRGIRNGNGPDFVIFENAHSDTFLELAFVQVSSDDINYFQFPTRSLTRHPVSEYGQVDPTQIDGFAGKFRQGYGVPFDLEDLRGVSPLLDVENITHVRLVDVPGDGSVLDSFDSPIYDPYPTTGSAGFDLDAVGIIHEIMSIPDIVFVVELGPGWNLISTPLDLTDNDCAAVLGATTDVWRWEHNAFAHATHMHPGIGYWVFSGSQRRVYLQGQPTNYAGLPEMPGPGWHLVGPYTQTEIPIPGIVEQAWGWDPLYGLYRDNTTLRRGVAYWVHSD